MATVVVPVPVARPPRAEGGPGLRLGVYHHDRIEIVTFKLKLKDDTVTFKFAVLL
jgi:hypothetical protein